MGYYLAGSFPPIVRLGLVFLNPVYFLVVLIGEARSLYAYAGIIEGKGRDEDDFAYLRDAAGFRNILLVEQPNDERTRQTKQLGGLGRRRAGHGDAARKQVTVTVRQTQASDVYRVPLEIGLAVPGAEVPRIERVSLTGRETTFTIASDTEPESVTLDPGTWLLFDAGPFVREP